MTTDAIQPAEPAAPDANVTQEGNGADPSPAVNDADDSKKALTGVSKRIDELTGHWRSEQRSHQETARDRDYWRDLAMRGQPQQQQTQQPAQDETPKTLADFEYDEAKYQAYVYEQVEKRAVKAARGELTADQERQAAQRRKESFRGRSTEFAKTVEDYESTVRNPRLSITADMAEVIEDSEDGPALAYHLGKHPEVADRIAQLPPKAAARELGKIEARLAYEREQAEAAKKRVSNAPPPPPKVEGAGDGSGTVDPSSPDSDELSDAEWSKRRAKQLARKRA